MTQPDEHAHTEPETAFLAELEDARQRIRNLETALATNRRIGIAVGIVMTRLGLTEDEAFQRLVAESQASGRKLRSVADTIVHQGDLHSEIRRPPHDKNDRS